MLKKVTPKPKNQLDNDIMVCPICGYTGKNLTPHILLFHKYKTSADFLKEYPGCGFMSVNRGKPRKFVCSICGETFKQKHIKPTNKNSLEQHLLEKHNIVTKPRDTAFTPLRCPICGKQTPHLYDHIIKKHRIEWDDFCKEYEYTGPKTVFSEEHKKQLSINKKKFYDSDKGYIRKLQQSKDQAGEKNFVFRPGAMEKISSAAAERQTQGHNFNKHSHGLKVVFQYEGSKYFCRSFEEFSVMIHLLKAGKPFLYEKTIVQYKMNRQYKKYVLDFEIDGEYFEIKSKEDIKKTKNLCKFIRVSEELQKINKQLNIVDYIGLCDILGIIPLKPVEIREHLKELLNMEDTRIQQTLKPGCKSRILSKIVGDEYLNHPQITITRWNPKNKDNQKEDNK